MEEISLDEIERRVEIVKACFIDDFLLRAEPLITPIEIFNKILALVQVPLTFGIGSRKINGSYGRVLWFSGEEGYGKTLNDRVKKDMKEGEISSFNFCKKTSQQAQEYVFFTYQVVPEDSQSSLIPISSKPEECNEHQNLLRLTIQYFLDSLFKENKGINKSFITAITKGLDYYFDFAITVASQKNERKESKNKQDFRLSFEKLPKELTSFDLFNWFEEGGISDCLYSDKIRRYSNSVRYFNQSFAQELFDIPDLIVYARSDYLKEKSFRNDPAFNYRLKIIMGNNQKEHIKQYLQKLRDYYEQGKDLCELGINRYQEVSSKTDHKQSLLESYDELFFRALTNQVSINSKGEISHSDMNEDKSIEALLDIFLNEFEHDVTSFADACFVSGLIYFRFPFQAGGIKYIKNHFPAEDIGGHFHVGMLRVCIAHYIFEAMKPQGGSLIKGGSVALALIPIYVWSRIPIVVAHVITTTDNPSRLSNSSIWHQTFHVTQNLSRELKRHFRKNLEQQFISLIIKKVTGLYSEFMSKSCEITGVSKAFNALNTFFESLSYQLPFPKVIVTLIPHTQQRSFSEKSEIQVAGTILKLDVKENHNYPYSNAFITYKGNLPRLESKLLEGLRESLSQHVNQVITDIIRPSHSGFSINRGSVLIKNLLSEFQINEAVLKASSTPRLEVMQMLEMARQGISPVEEYKQNEQFLNPIQYINHNFGRYLKHFSASSDVITLKEFRCIVPKKSFNTIKCYFYRNREKLDVTLSEIFPKSIDLDEKNN